MSKIQKNFRLFHRAFSFFSFFTARPSSEKGKHRGNRSLLKEVSSQNMVIILFMFILSLIHFHSPSKEKSFS